MKRDLFGIQNCSIGVLSFLTLVVIPIEIPNPGYIIALGWIAFLLLGSMFTRIFNLFAGRTAFVPSR
jgi:hypothetical protein